LKIPKGNQNLYIQEEQTTQWSKEKVLNTMGVTSGAGTAYPSGALEFTPDF
jgi:hypothetical protein